MPKSAPPSGAAPVRLPEERGAAEEPSAEVFTRTPARPFLSADGLQQASLGVRASPPFDGAQGRGGSCGKEGMAGEISRCAGDGGGFS